MSTPNKPATAPAKARKRKRKGKAPSNASKAATAPVEVEKRRRTRKFKDADPLAVRALLFRLSATCLERAQFADSFADDASHDDVARVLLGECDAALRAFTDDAYALECSLRAGMIQLTERRVKLLAICGLRDQAEAFFAEPPSVDSVLALALAGIQARELLAAFPRPLDEVIADIEAIQRVYDDVHESETSARAKATSVRPRASRFVSEFLCDVPGIGTAVRALHARPVGTGEPL